MPSSSHGEINLQKTCIKDVWSTLPYSIAGFEGKDVWYAQYPVGINQTDHFMKTMTNLCPQVLDDPYAAVSGLVDVRQWVALSNFHATVTHTVQMILGKTSQTIYFYQATQSCSILQLFDISHESSDQSDNQRIICMPGSG